MPRIPRSFLVTAGSLASLVGLVAACGDPELPAADTPPPETAQGTLPPTAPPTTEDPSAGESVPEVVVGREWVDVTSNLTGMESWCGTLSFVAARPDNEQVLAAVAGQGLFSNVPGSDQWEPFGRGDSSAPLDHRTSGIVYDPDDPDVFWESGYFGLGPPPDASASSVNRTDDGGATFVAVGDDEPADLVSVDFSDPERQTLLVGVRGQERAVLSTDGGATWTDVSDDLPTDLGEASFPYVLDANTFLLGTHKGDRGAGASPGIFRTTDAGASWEKVFEGGVSGPVLPSEGGGLFWVLDEGGVVGSDDGGVTWTVVADRGPGGGEFLDARRNRIVETSDGTWLSMSESAIVMSTDRGATWERILPGLPFVPAGFTFSESRNELYVWQNYCDFQADTNPVTEESIVRLEFDPTP